MNSIRMNRQELLDLVKENKQKHINEYEESVVDYKAAVIKIAKANLKVANTGSDNMKFTAFPTPPVSYEKEYTKAIRMLELSVDEVIDVEDYIFNQLVLDEWSWKSAFQLSASLYKGI